MSILKASLKKYNSFLEDVPCLESEQLINFVMQERENCIENDQLNLISNFLIHF